MKQEEATRIAAQLEEQRSELAALRAAQQQQRDAVVAARQEKGSTLAAANADLAELERQEDQLLQQSQSLTSIINGNSGGGHGSGSMMWPVNGTVTSGFGYRIHPILGGRRPHTGIDIAAGNGTTIWAADGGQRHLRHLDQRLRQHGGDRPRRRDLDAVRAPVRASPSATARR